jgi:hemoglobin
MMQSPYDALGGDAGVRELVDRFYHYMDTLPEAAGIRRLHPDDLNGSIEKLYLFLSGWFGGPSLYIEKYGHPRLRARHLPFPIGDEERDQWMLCMDKALSDMPIEDDMRRQLHKAFSDMADHMRNRAPAGPATGIVTPDNS